MFRLQPLLAHQGGWDEIALFAIPVVIALLAVRLVERRSSKLPEQGDTEEGDDEASVGDPEHSGSV